MIKYNGPLGYTIALCYFKYSLCISILYYKAGITMLMASYSVDNKLHCKWQVIPMPQAGYEIKVYNVKMHLSYVSSITFQSLLLYPS